MTYRFLIGVTASMSMPRCRGARAAGRLAAAAAAASLLTVLLTSGCSSDDPQVTPGPVVIGVLAAQTGPDAKAGKEAVQGARLAEELVNSALPDIPLPLAGGRGLPNLNGASLTVVVGDTKGVRDGSDEVAAGLVSEQHALALVVADGPEVADSVAAESQRRRVPTVDATSSANFLTEQGRDWYFRLGPSDEILSAVTVALIDYVRGTRGARPRLALLQPASGESAAEAAATQGVVEQAGYPVVPLKVSASQDPTGTAAAVAAANPDAVLAVAGSATDAQAIAAMARQLPARVPLIGMGSGFAGLGAVPADGPVVLRSVAWSAEYATRNPTAVAVAKRYQARFGQPMTAAAASAFTATLAVAAAIDAGQSTETTQIRAELRRIWLPATQTIMPWDGVRFDGTGQNQLAAGLVEQRSTQGYQVVFPRELARVAVLWQPGNSGSSAVTRR